MVCSECPEIGSSVFAGKSFEFNPGAHEFDPSLAVQDPSQVEEEAVRNHMINFACYFDDDEFPQSFVPKLTPTGKGSGECVLNPFAQDFEFMLPSKCVALNPFAPVFDPAAYAGASSSVINFESYDDESGWETESSACSLKEVVIHSSTSEGDESGYETEDSESLKNASEADTDTSSTACPVLVGSGMSSPIAKMWGSYGTFDQIHQDQATKPADVSDIGSLQDSTSTADTSDSEMASLHGCDTVQV